MFTGSDGEAVDPVPFLVVVAFGLLVSVAFLPVYVLSLGASLWVGVLVAITVPAAFAVLVYRRMVWHRNDEVHREVSAEARLQTIVYGVLVACAAMGGLSLVLLV